MGFSPHELQAARLQERAQVVTVVVRRVVLCVVGGGEGGHLVAVDRVIKVEVLHLLGNLRHDIGHSVGWGATKGVVEGASRRNGWPGWECDESPPHLYVISRLLILRWSGSARRSFLALGGSEFGRSPAVAELREGGVWPAVLTLWGWGGARVGV